MYVRVACVIAFAVAGAPNAYAQTPPAPPPCETAEHRAFDFWVGEWVVTRADTGAQVAESRIEKLYTGCAIRENWMPTGGAGGGSINAYDPQARLWRQSWVDSTGAWVDFSGGVVDKTLVLTGLWRNYVAPGKDALIRMTYRKREDGSVSQVGEQSTDFGKNWSIAFAFIYRLKTGKTR
jgi:hypothetical protein